MNFRSHSLFSRRLSSLIFLLGMTACLAGLTPALHAQTAHFSRAIRIPGGAAAEANRNALAVKIGVGALPEDIQTTHGDFGPVNIGSSSAKAMVFTFDTDVTLGSVAVVTQGAKGLDFTNPGGGTCKPGTAFKAGDTCTVRVTFKPRHPGIRYGAAQLIDASGSLLATGYVQGTGVGPWLTFAHVQSGVDLAATVKTYGYIETEGVAVDGSGNVFIGEFGLNYGSSSGLIEIMAVDGSIPASPTIRTLVPGIAPPGVAVDGSGNVFFLTSDVKEIVAINGSIPDSPTIKTVATGFSRPTDLAVDGSGNVFVADTGNNAVKEIVAAGGYATVNTLASGFSSPSGIAVDGIGNLFVLDGWAKVKEIFAAGGYTDVKSLGSAGFGKLPVVTPRGVAVDGIGNVYVSGGWDNGEVHELVAVDGSIPVSPEIRILAKGIRNAWCTRVDGNGNLYVASLYAVVELDYADPPSLSFAWGAVGSRSPDSPQIVRVTNNGNAALTFPTSAIDDNPTVPAAFQLDAKTTCPEVRMGSSTAATLAAGASCNYAVDFIPAELDTNSGSLTLTDNSLNANPAVMQTISVTGQGFGPATQLVYTRAPDALKLSSSRPVAVKVAIEDAGGRLVTTPSATVTLTVTGPNSYSRLYTAGAVGGVATFWNLDYLSAGAYTYTATDASDGVAPAVANQTVWSYHLAFTVPPAAWLAPGQTPGTVKVSPKNFLDRTMLWNYCIVQLAVTGPNGYSQVYTTALSSGTATFSTLPALTTKGNYTYTASNTDCGATSAVANELVNLPPPFGALDLVVDNTTFSTTVGQSDSFRVRGWVADQQDGVPLNNVTVYVDGTSIGAPTLGLPRPTVAAQYGNAYLNSGYLLLYPAASLSLGTHKVTVVAIDSGGRSTTLGPRTFIVAATAGPGAPFGAIGAAVDGVTGSTTVSQSHSLKVWGWVADPQDGAPLSNVQVYVDGVSIGTPTLGLPRPNIAATYGSQYLNSGFLLLYPASSLSLGTHKVTVVAVDSGGRSSTIGPHIITVQ